MTDLLSVRAEKNINEVIWVRVAIGRRPPADENERRLFADAVCAQVKSELLNNPELWEAKTT